VNLKCLVFGGKTGPFPMVLVFHVVRPGAKVRFRVEPAPELNREFRTVANTTRARDCSRFCCNSFKPLGEPKDSLHRNPVVRQELGVFSPYGTVTVPY